MLETPSLLLVVEIRPAGVAGATHHPRRSGDLKLGASGWVSGPASGLGGRGGLGANLSDISSRARFRSCSELCSSRTWKLGEAPAELALMGCGGVFLVAGV